MHALLHIHYKEGDCAPLVNGGWGVHVDTTNKWGRGGEVTGSL